MAELLRRPAPSAVTGAERAQSPPCRSRGSVPPADAAPVHAGPVDAGAARRSAERTCPERLGLLGQIARFAAVGVGCTLLDYGSYIALGVLLGWPYWLAKTLAFFLGTIASYLGNRRFTFRAGQRGPRAEIGGFVVLYGATFAANLGCNELLLQITGTGPGEFRAATLIWIVAQTAGTVINFVLLRTVVFPERG